MTIICPVLDTPYISLCFPGWGQFSLLGTIFFFSRDRNILIFMGMPGCFWAVDSKGIPPLRSCALLVAPA